LYNEINGKKNNKLQKKRHELKNPLVFMRFEVSL